MKNVHIYQKLKFTLYIIFKYFSLFIDKSNFTSIKWFAFIVIKIIITVLKLIFEIISFLSF